MRFFKLVPFLFVLCIFDGCQREEKVPEPYRPTDAYDAYLSGLKQTNIINTALGRKWLAASKKVIRIPVNIPVPYSETFHIDPNHPNALGLRFGAKRGQAVEVQIRADLEDSTFLFVDLYRLEIDSLNIVKHVATADSVQHSLIFEPRQDAEYILRIIPEILGGGKFTVQVKNTPTLAFPVAGKNKWAIQSKFGAARDGGKREHHGVDIFAKRHTPIIAPIRAQVRSVGEQKLGGNVIWLRDPERRTNLYFAHLQKQLVEEGEWVNPGDTIGTVGNSGNAKSTPPHLHFGIYSRGPINPYNYIVELDTIPDKIEAPEAMVGLWGRVKQKVSLRSVYGNRFEAIEDLDPDVLLKIQGASGRFFRVSRENGVSGYVLARTLESTDIPVSTLPNTDPPVIQ